MAWEIDKWDEMNGTEMSSTFRSEPFQDSHYLFPLFDEFLYVCALEDKDMDGERHLIVIFKLNIKLQH